MSDELPEGMSITRKMFKVDGKPLTGELRELFSPWGDVKGITSGETGIRVAFHGGPTLKFEPHYDD